MQVDHHSGGPGYSGRPGYSGVPGYSEGPGQYRHTSGSNTSHLPGKQRYQSISRKTPWIYCDLCGNASNSPEQAKIHDMGKKHRKKMEARYGKELVPSTTNPATMRPVGHGRPETGNPHHKETPRWDNRITIQNKDLQADGNLDLSSIANMLMELEFNVQPSVQETELNHAQEVLSVPTPASDQGVLEEHLRHTPDTSAAVLQDQKLSNFLEPQYDHILYNTGFSGVSEVKILPTTMPTMPLDSLLNHGNDVDQEVGFQLPTFLNQ